MSNQAWECPRCGKMNAPFNPTCFCDPPPKSSMAKIPNLQDLARDVLERSRGFDRCLVCDGYHGHNVQCVYLKAM